MEHIHSQKEADRFRTYSTDVNCWAENAASVIMGDLGNCEKG